MHLLPNRMPSAALALIALAGLVGGCATGGGPQADTLKIGAYSVVREVLHDALLPAFPDMELPLEDFVAEGEKVLVRLRVKGTHTGAFGELQATGRKIDIDVLDLFHLRDGMLVEHWALLDNLGMLKQLGALPN